MNDDPAQEYAVQLFPAQKPGRHEVVVEHADGKRCFRDTVDPSSGRSRQKLVAAVRKKCPGISEGRLEELDDELSSADLPARRRDPTSSATEGYKQLAEARDAEAQKLLGAMGEDVVDEARELLAAPDLLDVITQDIEALGVVGERHLARQAYLIFTSRLLDAPLCGLVQGTSSSGKSFVPETVARLFPPEALLVATDMTPNALYYVEPRALVHRAILSGERARRKDDDQAEMTRALRELMSSGRLTKVVTEKGPGGELLTRCIERHGPIAYVESTTETSVFDENANRMLLLGTDESSEQTRRILDAVAARAASPRGDAGSDPERGAVYHAVQRLLHRVRVVVPFASAITCAMPADRPEARRAAGQVFAMVKAVALLHQYQRTAYTLDHGVEIAASLDDYAVARELLLGPLGRALGGDLPRAVAGFGARLRESFGDGTFTTSEALSRDPILNAKSKVNEYLSALADAGCAEVVAASQGPRPSSYRMVDDVPVAGALWLPCVPELREAS